MSIKLILGIVGEDITEVNSEQLINNHTYKLEDMCYLIHPETTLEPMGTTVLKTISREGSIIYGEFESMTPYYETVYLSSNKFLGVALEHHHHYVVGLHLIKRNYDERMEIPPHVMRLENSTNVYTTTDNTYCYGPLSERGEAEDTIVKMREVVKQRLILKEPKPTLYKWK